MSNLSALYGLENRVRSERQKNAEHQQYMTMVARAISSGELPVNTTGIKPIALARGFTAAVEAATGAVFQATGDNLQAKVNAAVAGDTVYLLDGIYNFVGQLITKSGVKITGGWGWGTVVKDGISMVVPVCKSKLIFKTPKGTNWAQKQCFGIVVPGNSSNVTIEGIALESNNGIFFLDGNSQNISIIHCDGRWGYDGNYYSRHFIYTPGPIKTLIWEENFLHGGDADTDVDPRNGRSGDRNCELWGVTGLQYNYNIFYNINDGGHLMNLGPDCSYSFNYGRRIHRMGIEVQQDAWPGPEPKNFLIEGNVFFDWDRPYWDSMLMSVPSVSTTTETGQLTIRKNYLRGNAWQGKWGPADSSNQVRGSYGIECPQRKSLVNENIIGGERMVGQLVRPGGNADCVNNKTFGEAPWFGNKAVGNEPGSDSSYVGKDTNNTIQPFSAMPPPPIQPLKNSNPPLETQMQTAATAYTTFVRATVSGTKNGNVVLEWRGKDMVYREPLIKGTNTPAVIGALPQTSDVYAPEWKPGWEVWISARDASGRTPEVKVIIGANPDPAPPNPGPLTVHMRVTTTTNYDVDKVSGAVTNIQSMSKAEVVP